MIEPSKTYAFRSGRILQVAEIFSDRVYYSIKGVRTLIPSSMSIQQFMKMVRERDLVSARVVD